MANASVSIREAANSAVSRLYYKLTLASGAEAAGKEIVVTLEGDGSLSPAFDSKVVKRAADETGAAMVTWYRRSIFGRDIKATLSAESEAGEVAVEQTEDGADGGPRISHIQRKII